MRQPHEASAAGDTVLVTSSPRDAPSNARYHGRAHAEFIDRETRASAVVRMRH